MEVGNLKVVASTARVIPHKIISIEVEASHGSGAS
jgi:hypothetical protein